MARKINIFTFLIFIYSVVICVTCKRDFSQDSAKVQLQVSDKLPIELKNGGASTTQKTSMTASAVVFKKSN